MQQWFFITLSILIPITLFVFEFVFYKVKRQVALDQARANMFKIRNDLFLYSLEHGLQDKEASYQIRKRLNSHIRFAHKADFISFYIFTIKMKNNKLADKNFKKLSKETNKYLNSLSDNHRKVYQEALENSRMEVFGFMVHSSPVLSCVLNCVSLVFNLNKIFDKHKDSISKNLDLEINAAYAC